ncbi:hypothetical protein FQZ97_796700 [compost metagenome]
MDAGCPLVRKPPLGAPLHVDRHAGQRDHGAAMRLVPRAHPEPGNDDRCDRRDHGQLDPGHSGPLADQGGHVRLRHPRDGRADSCLDLARWHAALVSGALQFRQSGTDTARRGEAEQAADSLLDVAVRERDARRTVARTRRRRGASQRGKDPLSCSGQPRPAPADACHCTVRRGHGNRTARPS